MSFIEIIGFPGSGKTYLFKKIINEINKKEMKIIRNDKYLFNYFEKSFFDKILFSIFYQYKLSKKFYSKYIFNKQYKFLTNKIDSIIKKKNLLKVNKVFKQMLENSKLNKPGKKRSYENFKIDLCSYFLEKKSKQKIVINDEGLLQKIFMIYKKKNDYKNLRKIINEYLKLIPKPDFVILLDTDNDLCFERASLRKKGFVYEVENKKEIFGLFIKIMNDIKKILIKNRIKVITIKGNQINKKNILEIKKNFLK